LGAESVGAKGESEGEWCLAALSKVHDATAMQITICVQPKRWWNGKIKGKRSQLGREMRRRGRLAVTVKAKAAQQKLVGRVKDMICHDYRKHLRGAEVWRAAISANPRPGMPEEASTVTDGMQLNTFAAKHQMLTPTPILPNQYKQ